MYIVDSSIGRFMADSTEELDSLLVRIDSKSLNWYRIYCKGNCVYNSDDELPPLPELGDEHLEAFIVVDDFGRKRNPPRLKKWQRDGIEYRENQERRRCRVERYRMQQEQTDEIFYEADDVLILDKMIEFVAAFPEQFDDVISNMLDDLESGSSDSLESNSAIELSRGYRQREE